MPDMSWNPPTGPPIGEPVRPADARREIEQAVEAADVRDRELRSELAEVVIARCRAAHRAGIVRDEEDEARDLAKRALTKANDSARAGQRADAGKWTAAAQVFAMRLRDGRHEAAALEQRIAAAGEQQRRVETALAENVGRLQAVAAARLPALGGRKAARLQHAVDDTVAAISAPTSDLVTRATEAARTAAVEAPDAAAARGPVTPVADEDLEREVDVESTDGILDELRKELGLAPAAAGPAGPASTPPPAGPAGNPAAPSGESAVPAGRR